jgi:hypothetical protein
MLLLRGTITLFIWLALERKRFMVRLLLSALGSLLVVGAAFAFDYLAR